MGEIEDMEAIAQANRETSLPARDLNATVLIQNSPVGRHRIPNTIRSTVKRD
jgi:hypothetical protein